MKILLWTVGPALVTLAAFWIWVSVGRRKRDRSEVSPAWLNEHVYHRTGDDSQSK